MTFCQTGLDRMDVLCRKIRELQATDILPSPCTSTLKWIEMNVFDKDEYCLTQVFQTMLLLPIKLVLSLCLSVCLYPCLSVSYLAVTSNSSVKKLKYL